MYPRRPTYVGLRANRACRMTYLTLIGMEKCFMPSKGKVQARYRRFPDFFVTRKSSKSRMGKGKGKIMGRVLRIKKNEVVLDIKAKNIFKAKKSLRALRLAIPTTTKLTFKNRWVRRRLTMIFRNRS
jgi:ribosomal protein L16/L10AE